MTKAENPLEETIRNLVNKKKFQSVIELLKKPENDEMVSKNIWNLINVVCFMVKTNNLLQNDSDIDLCQKILFTLVDKGKPKEVIIALMEEADSFKNHEFFCLLLEPLKKTLKNAPGKRGKSLEWVLSTLNAHITTLSVPEDLDLQGEEKLLLDADPAVIDANYVLSNYLHFLETFVDEVSFENLAKSEFYFSERVAFQQEILHKYILQIFYHPLLFHDLHVESEEKPKSTIRVLCEKYISCLSKICHNIFNLFKYDLDAIKDKKEDALDEDADNISVLAFSNLAYLIFVENLALNFRPFVFSHHYIFMKNLKYIISLLSRKENLVLFKGLSLAQVLLDKLIELELCYDFMELDAFINFPKVLLNIGIYCQIEAHRNLAVKIFLNYASKCDWKARYHLIMQVLSTVNHSGAEGLVISLYKNYLHDSLNGGSSSKHFLGKNLSVFLQNVFILKEGVETDILENSDKIITTLNLLRYLLLRDRKDENITGTWDLIARISENFLEPLSKGLDLSKAHYKQAAKDAELEKKQKSVNTTVRVNNEILPNVPPDFQKDVFDRALITFDMIESILSRVRELLPK